MKKLLASVFIFTLVLTAYAAAEFSAKQESDYSKGAKAQYLAGGHAKDQSTSCIDCHDSAAVSDSETAENQKCIDCHGDIKVMAVTTAEKYKEAKEKLEVNPHESHLDEINCTACHAAHAPSFVYCNHCHSFADLNIPFAGSKPKFAPFDVKDYAKAAPLRSEKYDLVIVGSGGAGFAAAVVAQEAGAKVVILEKMPIPGGNSQLSAGGTNAAWTKFQKANKPPITDSPENMFYDTMKGGGFINDPTLVNILAFKSNETIEWLSARGIDLSHVNLGAAASQPRFHAPAGGIAVGSYLINNFKRLAKQQGIEIRLNSTVVRINTNKAGEVTGVLVKGKYSGLYEINAKSVILTAGGFSSNAKMVESLKPEYKGMTTSNQPGALGEGMRLAETAGAKLIDMEQIQIHPSVAVGSQILITEAVRGAGAILVNHEGTRFFNELDTRAKVSRAILEQKGQTAFMVFDDDTIKRLAQINGYFHLGLVKSGKTPSELAAAIDVPSDIFENTVKRYNSFVVKKNDEDYGRPNMAQELKTGRLHAIEIAPGIHYTMGGAQINTDAQVIGKNGKPIKNLYAAGEVTGGVHGNNRLGGNSTSEMITFGRIAGTSALKNAGL